MPYVGVHSLVGQTGANLSPGLHAGAILGGRLYGGPVALAGELVCDVLNPNVGSDGVDRSVVEVELAFSLLLIGDFDSASVFIAPRLGLWGGSQSEIAGPSTLAGGLSLGGSGGAFVRAGSAVSIGVIAGFVWRDVSQICTASRGPTRVCRSNPGIDGDKVVSVAAALLF